MKEEWGNKKSGIKLFSGGEAATKSKKLWWNDQEKTRMHPILPTLSVFSPKYEKARTATHWSNLKPPARPDGIAWNTWPIKTEIMVITDNAAIEPVKEMSLDVFMANKPAMKKVLSPISETNTREKAWGGRGGEGMKEGYSCPKFPHSPRFYSLLSTTNYLQEPRGSQLGHHAVIGGGSAGR